MQNRNSFGGVALQGGRVPADGGQRLFARERGAGPTPDEARKAAAVYALSVNFGKELPAELGSIWFKLLRDFTPEQVERGVQRVIETYEYRQLPPFAVLRKAIMESSNIPEPVDPERRRVLEAEAEWNLVRRKVREVGSYGHPRFCPATQAVVRAMGGWGQICSWRLDELNWHRKDFIEQWVRRDEAGPAMELGAIGVRREMAARKAGLAVEGGARNALEGPEAQESNVPSGFLRPLP